MTSLTTAEEQRKPANFTAAACEHLGQEKTTAENFQGTACLTILNGLRGGPVTIRNK
jgi:hypothetical protein